MIKINNPDQKAIVYKGKRYTLNSREFREKSAVRIAKSLRTTPYPWQESRAYGVIVVKHRDIE